MTCPKCEKRFSFKKMLLTLTIVAVGIYSLKTFGSSTDNKMSNGEQIKMSNEDRKDLDEKSKNQVLVVLAVNEKLHDAFFTFDAAKVELSAKKLKNEIENISHSEIAKSLNFSKEKLLNIKASSSREMNNQNDHIVSMALIYIVNTYDVGKDYDAYSCPMVKKKWLQSSKKVSENHSPYVSGMAHCGNQDSNY